MAGGRVEAVAAVLIREGPWPSRVAYRETVAWVVRREDGAKALGDVEGEGVVAVEELQVAVWVLDVLLWSFAM